MRVLHVARGFGDYMVGLINGLAPQVESHVVLAQRDRWLSDYLATKVQVFHSNAPPVRNPRNCTALRRVARYIREIRPDVLHFQSGLIWELGLLRMFPRIASVMTVHDLTRHPSTGTMRWFPQELLDLGGRLADTIIVHGESFVSAAEQRYRKRVFAIPHGLITRYGMGSGCVQARDGGRVLLFGTLDAWKGIEVLVAAAPLVRAQMPRVEVRIAGGCEDPDRYLRLVSAEAGVHMTPQRQSDGQVRQLFEWADVVVLPYVEASQSGVLQIAYAFGVPVVVTDVGALKEAVATDGCGLVVPPRDPARLAAAIITLLRDVDLRSRVIANIVQARRTRFDWGKLAIATLRVYEEARRLRFAGGT